MPGRIVMPRKPLVIVTRKLPDVIETRMAELFDARFNDWGAPGDLVRMWR